MDAIGVVPEPTAHHPAHEALLYQGESGFLAEAARGLPPLGLGWGRRRDQDGRSGRTWGASGALTGEARTWWLPATL
jgi:hypothetical protein